MFFALFSNLNSKITIGKNSKLKEKSLGNLIFKTLLIDINFTLNIFILIILYKLQ